MSNTQTPTYSLRTDLIASLVCHAALIGGMLALSVAVSPPAPMKRPDASGANASAAASLSTPSSPKSPEEAKIAALADADASAAASTTASAHGTVVATAEPARTAETTAKALLGSEVKQSVSTAVPLTASDSVKAGISAALDRAMSDAMANRNPDGSLPSRTEIELSAANSVINQLRSEVNAAFTASAAETFPRRAYDSALKQLEVSAAANLGFKERELLVNEGAALAGDDAAQVGKRTAELANRSAEGFRKTLSSEAQRILGKAAASGIADTAEEIVRNKLAEKGVAADPVAMVNLRDAITKGVAANTPGRGFNASATWKPSAELILPGTRIKKADTELSAKAAEVATKQEELIRSILPGLAAEVGKSAKWNGNIEVSKETQSKIDTMKRLETLVSNLKAGRGGAAESGLASSLASLLGSNTGSGSGVPKNESDLEFDSSGASGGSVRNFKEDEYQKLLSRLKGRPANAGAEPDIQRVAGDAINASAAAGMLAPARIVTLAATVAEPAPDDALAEIPAPPFPSTSNTVAYYATKRPTIDGDLSDWNLNTAHAKVRLLTNNTPLANGPDVYLQWRGEGLYFGYRLADTGGVQVSSGAPYHGDMAELFVDTTNSRAPRMRDSNSAHQYFFMPFGFKGDSTLTFQRARSGVSWPKGMDLATLNSLRTVSFCAAKQEAGGYTVEGFLGIEALQRRLAPGIYLGFDISISPDLNFDHQMQWAAAKSLGNWDRPSTWGDILLVGTTARALFLRSNGETATAAAAGETLTIQIDDADMNLDAGAREVVAVKVALADGTGSQVLLLNETGPDTGVFQGPCALFGPGAAATSGAVIVVGGQTVQLTYIDAVSGVGQRNRAIAKQLNIGWPVLRLLVKGKR
ncbi:MAG: hypothetical protein H7Y06_04690 [Opitutaceae bacterium]|nr:hypothetical protein [Opitutaceae bacterium]